jgi:predicted porin
MNKKLLAVAVASVLAAPATALAQVTISGIFKVGMDQIKVGNPAATRTQSSQMRVVDNSSRILFNVTEDLGGGLAAIGQLDVRFSPDQAGGGTSFGTVTSGAIGGTANPIGTGNTWVGLRSNSWGSITLGRHDLHYGKQPDDIAAKAGALMAAAVSLMDYANAGASAVATASRTQNVARWDSPNWGGFTITGAYSTSPLAGTEGDMAAGANQKGSGINFNPAFTASNWQIGVSTWNAKSEATNAAEQKATVVYGYWRMGGWKIGAASNSSELDTAGVKSSDRKAWTVPVSYTTGAHNFYAHYTKAGNDKVIAGETGAKMMAFAYVYDLSKRTSVGATYAKIDNGLAAKYNFFTGTSLGSADTAVGAGEDPQMLQFTVRHAF